MVAHQVAQVAQRPDGGWGLATDVGGPVSDDLASISFAEETTAAGAACLLNLHDALQRGCFEQSVQLISQLEVRPTSRVQAAELAVALAADAAAACTHTCHPPVHCFRRCWVPLTRSR